MVSLQPRRAPYAGFETFFLAAADAFADEPTVARLETLYDTRIPVRDPDDTSGSNERASPISNAAAARLGWTPTTRWTAGGNRRLTVPDRTGGTSA